MPAEHATRWQKVMPTLAAIAVAVVLPRLLVLQITVIDWDESLYALVAQQWLAGHVPHETVYDHKPIGLFGIFALFFLAFGDTVLAIRLIPIVFVAATAAVLARIAYETLGRNPWAAGLAASLYGLLTLANGGLATNTELLVNFFVVLALWLLIWMRLDSRVSAAGSVAVGASLGLAFQVNFLAGFLVLGVAAFYLSWMALRQAVAAMVLRYLVNGAWMLAGFVAASIAVTLPVLLFGDPSDYFGLKLAYLREYPGVGELSTAVRRISEALLPYWPFWALLVPLCAAALGGPRTATSVWSAPASPRDGRLLAWIALLAFALIAAFASGRFYHHFFLFTAPALVLLAVTTLQLASLSAGMRKFLGLWLLVLGGACVPASQDVFLRGIRAQAQVNRGRPADAVAAQAAYLSARLQAGETIYVFDGQPVLYFLTRTTPPIRFAFPESHLREDVAVRFGLTPVDAVRRILDVEPRFVVAHPGISGLGISDAGIVLKDALDRHYRPARQVEPGAPAHVYERVGTISVTREPD